MKTTITATVLTLIILASFILAAQEIPHPNTEGKSGRLVSDPGETIVIAFFVITFALLVIIGVYKYRKSN